MQAKGKLKEREERRFIFHCFIVDDDNLIELDPLSRFLDCHHTYINASHVLVSIKLIEVLFFHLF